jgi:decaprenylphospho-beta-D-ribofuranose 2-oxidase
VIAPLTGRRVLSGWGRTAPSSAVVLRPASVDELEQALVSGPPALIPRGLGRSYGDAAQCAGGTVVDTSPFDEMAVVDPQTGLLEVGGGVVLGDVMRRMLELGWFVPVTPGTRQVTVGGAIAADIHGKNHHRDGSFCRHVAQCTIVTPTGTVTVSPDSDPALFWATAGGMGLTGVITRATVRLIPVESSWMLVDTDRFDDLDSLMSTMEATDAGYRYSVAWVDCMGGPRTGRAVLTRGDHAPRDATIGRQPAPTLPERPRVRVPLAAPRGLLNPVSIRLFNEVWFRKSPRHEERAPQLLSSFFHPLDGVADWNLLYGSSGFVQYQFAVGPDQGEAVVRAIAAIGDSRVPSFLAVLKRFGEGDPGPLSFPMEGWTLALDFPIGPPALRPLLDRLDQLVVEARGRVYLAKDARLRPELLPIMYPRLAEFSSVRDRVDPERVLQSDLSRRLRLEGGVRSA